MAVDDCVVVIMTFNSVKIIGETISQALKVSPHVFVVDSGSTDGTVDKARSMGCEVVHREFINGGDQRNWTIDRLNQTYTWQLHLDADEVLDERAVAGIQEVLTGSSVHVAFMLKRRDYFMGKMLRFSGVNPWHLRLFKSGTARCESRLYDQHFVSSQPAAKLPGLMHDKNPVSLSDWTLRHNRWSDLESIEMGNVATKNHATLLQARLFGDARERTRFIKGLYYTLPLAIRAFSYFLYRYIFRLGFLDGMPGFYFAFFQAFWFRMLVDAKIYEKKRL
jgi:glycosyltransferase involved in cell wall biosynthesis